MAGIQEATSEASPSLLADESENVSGWACSQQNKWFRLQLDAYVDENEGTEVWHHDSPSWKKISGAGIGQTEPQQAWNTWNNTDFDRKDRDGDVPEWDGKMSHRTTYFRKIDLCEATTGVEPKKRGIRLLAKLIGEAFEKLENVDPRS